jgi:hypothetical protein
MDKIEAYKVSSELWLIVAELWHNQDYSMLDISRETGLATDQVLHMTDLLNALERVVKKGILEKVKEALDL